MCNIWREPTKESEEITPEIVAKLPRGFGRINLTGGEPMLRDDVEELVRVLYDKCRTVEISTNGFYTERLVRVAEKFPRVMIRISLEGLPELNDRLRGTRDGFDHALRSMLELAKTKVRDVGFSIVICDKNIGDLLSLYDLAVRMNVEFAQSTMHNSWYFHKSDNQIADRALVAREMEKFMAALLSSKRNSVKLRVKDWFRAFFNLRVYHYAKNGYSRQRTCSAGTDLFFLDPFGNILPCNGSDEQWVMGNLKDDSFESIWNSDVADIVRTRVKSCVKDCAFIGTARFDMLKNPMRTMSWIVKNKIRLMRGKPIWLEEEDVESSDSITRVEIAQQCEDEELVAR